MKADGGDFVVAHYGDGSLEARIRAALAEAGKDDERLTTRDLAPVDEFHSRGRLATEELATLAMASPDTRVVDIGSGLGGPARYLAERFGCHVTGVDLTPEFVEVARWLSECTGLDPRTRFLVGSGTDLPLPDGAFDVAWMVQMQMNIAAKDTLYTQTRRVLAPGGRLVLQELCAGESGPCRYPTPWAGSESISHLVPPDALRESVERAGFDTVEWRDTTEETVAWYEHARAKAAAAPTPLGTHLVMGVDAAAKRENVERNYAERRLRQVVGAFVRRQETPE